MKADNSRSYSSFTDSRSSYGSFITGTCTGVPVQLAYTPQAVHSATELIKFFRAYLYKMEILFGIANEFSKIRKKAHLL